MKAKKGQILILTLLIMAIGLIMISPLLHYLDSSYTQYLQGIIKNNAYYTADAMMTNILNDVYSGVDVYSNNVSSPYGQSNYLSSGYNISVVINNTMPVPLPTPESSTDWIYLDPGISNCPNSSCDPTLLLGQLDYGDIHDFQFYLPGGNQVQVNWASNDEGVCCMWGCDSGTCSYHVGGTMWMLYPNGSAIPGVAVNGSTTSTALNLYLSYSVPAGASGNYTIRFQNTGGYRQSGADIFCGCSGNQTRPSFSAVFSAANESDHTWVRVGKQAGGQVYSYQDYTITATAKQGTKSIVSITAYVRHTPGPLAWWKEQTVDIPSWQITYYP